MRQYHCSTGSANTAAWVYGYADACSYSYGSTDTDSYADACSHSYACTNSDRCTDSNANADAHADTCTNFNTNTGTNAARDAAADHNGCVDEPDYGSNWRHFHCNSRSGRQR